MHMLGLQIGPPNDRHRLSLAPANPCECIPAQSEGSAVLACSIEELALLLRLLIESFGGEATNTALMKHIVRGRRSMLWDDTTLSSGLGRVLDELADCDAITLEDMDEAEVIARIAPNGVVLAYNNKLPVSYSPTFGQISG